MTRPITRQRPLAGESSAPSRRTPPASAGAPVPNGVLDGQGTTAEPSPQSAGWPAHAAEDADAITQMRLLVADLRDAARDGRLLAARYAALLTATVEEYCGEFEQRAVAILARLEAHE